VYPWCRGGVNRKVRGGGSAARASSASLDADRGAGGVARPEGREHGEGLVDGGEAEHAGRRRRGFLIVERAVGRRGAPGRRLQRRSVGRGSDRSRGGRRRRRSGRRARGRSGAARRGSSACRRTRARRSGFSLGEHGEGLTEHGGPRPQRRRSLVTAGGAAGSAGEIARAALGGGGEVIVDAAAELDEHVAELITLRGGHGAAPWAGRRGGRR
jgi:hypothetical protein